MVLAPCCAVVVYACVQTFSHDLSFRFLRSWIELAFRTQIRGFDLVQLQWSFCLRDAGCSLGSCCEALPPAITPVTTGNAFIFP